MCRLINYQHCTKTQILSQFLMLVLERLKQYHESGSIVVMHDFSVDRIIKLESKTQLIDSLSEKANARGGIIREGVTTTDVKGGNAVNLAYSLAKLGLNITLFTVADAVGSAILFSVFSKLMNFLLLNV